MTVGRPNGISLFLINHQIAILLKLEHPRIFAMRISTPDGRLLLGVEIELIKN